MVCMLYLWPVLRIKKIKRRKNSPLQFSPSEKSPRRAPDIQPLYFHTFYPSILQYSNTPILLYFNTLLLILQYFNTPILQYSNTPQLPLCTMNFALPAMETWRRADMKTLCALCTMNFALPAMKT